MSFNQHSTIEHIGEGQNGPKSASMSHSACYEGQLGVRQQLNTFYRLTQKLLLKLNRCLQPVNESCYGCKKKAVSRSHECRCGEEITPQETENGKVISCKEQGCETIWVSMRL